MAATAQTAARYRCTRPDSLTRTYYGDRAKPRLTNAEIQDMKQLRSYVGMLKIGANGYNETARQNARPTVAGGLTH